MKQSNTPEEYLAPEKPSKSEIKRRLEARQYLAEEISQMPDKWKLMPIPERLLDALKQTPNVRTHGGIRRHIQYLGKIMGAMSEDSKWPERRERRTLSEIHASLHKKNKAHR